MPLWLSRITALRATCADHSRSKGSGISCSGTRFNEERKSFTPLSVSFTSGGRSFMSIVYANVRRTCSDASSSFTTLYLCAYKQLSLHICCRPVTLLPQQVVHHHSVKSDVTQCQLTLFFSLKTSCFILCSKNVGKLRWADLDQKDVFISSHGKNSLPVLLNRMQMQFPTATFQLLLLFIFYFLTENVSVSWRKLLACSALCARQHM